MTDTFITCETSDSGLNTDITNLPVTLISFGVAFTTKSPFIVHYTNSASPYLNELFPSSAYANAVVNYFGTHRITDLGDGRSMGDVVKLLLGGDLCSRFDVIQEPIAAGSAQYIQCIASNQQVAGKYFVSEQVTPGFAIRAPGLRRASLDPAENFEFTVLPTISSVSPLSGNLGGQFLTITGSGFAAVAANNTVTVDGNPCKITSSSDNQISCTLSAKNPAVSSLLAASNSSAQQNGYIAGAGLKYTRYESLSSYSSMNNFVSAVRGQNNTFLGTPSETGFRAELKEGDTYIGNYGQAWNGYFTAPVDGTYTFRGISDDYFAFYIAPTFGSVDVPANPFIYSNIYQPRWSNFYYDDVATA